MPSLLKNKILRGFASLSVCLLLLPYMVTLAQPREEEKVRPDLMQSGITEETEEKFRISYEEVASNDTRVLYADMQKGFFALEDRESGFVWYSTPNDSLLDEYTSGSDKWTTRSQLVIGYLYREDVISSNKISKANSQRACIEADGGITVSNIENGIRVTYNFVELGITIPVNYYLRGESLVAAIDVQNINEGETCILTEINLLPAFGAGNWEEEGHLFVPDGSGALISFNNGVKRVPYEKMIYGNDMTSFAELDSTVEEAIRLPVFATIREDNVLMAVVTKGDASAAIRALNGHESCGYNAVSSIFKMRSLDIMTMFANSSDKRDLARLSDKPNTSTYEVVYTPLLGEDASYMGVAQTYRDYLIREKGLTKRVQTPSLALNFIGSVDVKSAILGIEYSKQEALTTFEQAQTVLRYLQAQGVDRMALRYQGWSNYGLLNDKIPSKAEALSNLGGNKAFSTLTAFLQNADNVLYPDVDLIRFRTGSKKLAVKTAFNEVVDHTERLRSVFATKLEIKPYRYLTPQKIVTVADTYLASFAGRQNATAISLSTLGKVAYSNHSQTDSFHRFFYPDEVQKVLKSYADSGLAIALEDANAFAAVYASRIYDAPTKTSGYDVFNAEIPFYQLVFHGYTSMTVMPMAQAMNANANFLKAVESGSELLYDGMFTASSAVTGTRYDHLYGTQYSLWADQAAALYKRYQPLLDKIYDQVIVAHTELAFDVMQTTFENGISVIVNYSDTDFVLGDEVVVAGGFTVLEGGAA